jgi:hypothetical protein
MRKILPTLMMILFSWQPCLAQGLIGTPGTNDFDRLKDMESRRLDILDRNDLQSFDARVRYGAVLWELANAYEGCNLWQDAYSAYNELNDLHLPKQVFATDRGCIIRATDDILKMDRERLEWKASAVEECDHVVINRSGRLPRFCWLDFSYFFRIVTLRADHWWWELKYWAQSITQRA